MLTLFRPAGLDELLHVYESGMRAFPALHPGEPVFNPLFQEAHAREIARARHLNGEGRSAFLLELKVDAARAAKLERRIVAAHEHEELLVPAERLSEFNTWLVGPIGLTAAWFSDGYTGFVPAGAALRGKHAIDQFVALSHLASDAGELAREVGVNHAAVFVNFPFWQQNDFASHGIDRERRDAILAKLRHEWAAHDRGALHA